MSPVQTCLSVGRSVLSQWKPRGWISALIQRTHLSFTLSQLSVRGPRHLPVPTFLVYCGPTSWRLQRLWPHLSLHLFLLEPLLSGRTQTISSSLEFACSAELPFRSAPAGPHVLSVYQEILWTVERWSCVFSDLPCWVQLLFPPCPQYNRVSQEAMGNSPSWRLTEHVMDESRRIFMTDEGISQQLKQGSGTGKEKWERTAQLWQRHDKSHFFVC